MQFWGRNGAGVSLTASIQIVWSWLGDETHRAESYLELTFIHLIKKFFSLC
jgi:hypothetical protein